MDITELSKELIIQIRYGASESDVIQLLADNAEALQLQQTGVMVCKCKNPKLKYKYNELGIKTYCKKCKNIYRL